DSSRRRCSLYARFFGLWLQPCRLRRRHACIYSFLFLFLLFRLTFLLWLFFFRFLFFSFFRLFLFRLCFFWLLFFFLLGRFLCLFFFFLHRRFFSFPTNAPNFVAAFFLAAFFYLNFCVRTS